MKLVESRKKQFSIVESCFFVSFSKNQLLLIVRNSCSLKIEYKLSVTHFLPEGQYYVKELDAGETHDLDETHYEFEFKASDHEQKKTIQIYGEPDENEESSPILNKLHLNRFVLKKVNEEAALNELNGYEFTFTGNAEGAVFTLEDEEKQVLQTVTVNEESLAIFEFMVIYIPVNNENWQIIWIHCTKELLYVK